MNEDSKNKERCKRAMRVIFGPVSAAKVDEMSESECVLICQEKVRTLIGDSRVQEFNDLLADFSNEVESDVERLSLCKKEKCKQIMLELFGPVSAAKVDNMSEDDCVKICKEKVTFLLGGRHAEKFDQL